MSEENKNFLPPELLPYVHYYATLATRDDLSQLKDELKNDIAKLPSREEVKLEIELAISKSENRILRWMGAMFMANIIVMGLLIKFLH